MLWHLIVVLICTPLMTNVLNNFPCDYLPCVCHLSEASICFFVCFLMKLFVLFFFSADVFQCSFYMLGAILLTDMCFANIFSQSVSHLLILLTGAFCRAKFKIFIKFNFSALCFMAVVRSLCPGLDHEDCLQLFFPQNLYTVVLNYVSYLTKLFFLIFSKYFSIYSDLWKRNHLEECNHIDREEMKKRIADR